MKYIVITTKHHDGFAMFCFQGQRVEHLSTRRPYGRDPLKELAAACRKQGIKLGFYYSQAQDWNNGGSAAGGKWDPAQEHSMDDYIDKIAVPQVREILTQLRQGHSRRALVGHAPRHEPGSRRETLQGRRRNCGPTSS